MINNRFNHEESSDEPPSDNERIANLHFFWRALLHGKSPGSTSWEVLEHLYYLAERSLAEDPPDIDQAESLTARALRKMAGIEEL